jgi:4-diphosphocytidyl-2C-methyl-D-erythritol kinase
MPWRGHRRSGKGFSELRMKSANEYGSGSTTFAVVRKEAAAEKLAEKFKSKFGQRCWIAVVAAGV